MLNWFDQQQNEARLFLESRVAVGVIILATLSVAISADVSATCSAYKNLATINEIHKSGNNTRFLEVKILDASITSAAYDGWNISTCTIVGCTSISLSDANDSDLPYIVIEKPFLPDRNRIPLGDGTGEGGDIILTDASGNTIDYLSVNDFRNQWWGWNNQYDASCTPAYDWEFPGTNTHTIAREPDGAGDWSDDAGNSGGTTESATNDSDPPPDGGTLEILSSSDVTVDAGTDATFTIVLSNAPKAYDASFDYTSIDNTAVATTDYTATSGTATISAGDTEVTVSIPTLGGSAGGVSFYFFISNPVSATIVDHVANGNINASTGVDHFLISYTDNTAINCVVKPVTVTAKNLDGSTDTTYTGSITLDTQSGSGTWTLNSGTLANFSDATAGDGLATYTFAAADNGEVTFDLDYQTGTNSIDVDAYAGATRDDDTEGDLVFSPSGFTVTAAPLAVPFLGVVNAAIPTQTAASNFQLYLAAFGTTATDPVCGIIESYTGAKNIKFWSGYNDPNTGTLQVAVNGSNIATTEGAAVAQVVTFNQGQAVLNPVSYPDVGEIVLRVKDDTVTPNLTGVSTPFIVAPAGFTLSNIVRTSDGFANPGIAVDQTGAAFMGAGDNFSVTVTAVNSLGNATPNYGQESFSEVVTLTPTLVAAGAANNWPIGFAIGFDGLFVNGVSTGTDFSWPEVGIITLTPSVIDYMGSADVNADVTGAVSVNVGRFYPDHFVTTTTPGSFENKCIAVTPFTYLGESFGYLSNPSVIVTAESAVNTTTKNYVGAWAKLTAPGLSFNYPSSDNTQLDEGGVSAITVTSTEGTAGRVDNGDGTLTFALGVATADSFSYVRNAGEVAAFTADMTIELTAVNDGDAVATDLATPRAINPAGNEQRFGRAIAMDATSPDAVVNSSTVTMPVFPQYMSATGWVTNMDDSCAVYTYSKVDSGITTTVAPTSAVTFSAGVGDLVLTLTGDSGDVGGSSAVSFVWPSWLRYDIDSVDQPTLTPDGNFYDDDTSATASFGTFQGDDRYLYWRESP